MSLRKRHIKSTKTSTIKSILNPNEISPFYDKSSKFLFDNLPFPNAIDSPHLDLTFLNDFPTSSNVHSFVLENPTNPTINLPKACRCILRWSHEDIEEIEKTRVSRKIRIFPSVEQKDLLSQCFGTTRFLYNRILDAIKTAYDEARKRINKQCKKGCIKIIKTKAN